jgi:hypothetical protein
MVYTTTYTYIYGDDWGMVYDIVLATTKMATLDPHPYGSWLTENI